MQNPLTTEQLQGLREVFQAAHERGYGLFKRTKGHNYDWERFTVDEAVEVFDCNLWVGTDELKDFTNEVQSLTKGKEAELEYDYRTAWTCGDGCCSESDYFSLVIQ